MLTALGRAYGFKKPYKFERAAAFLLALLGFLVIGAIGLQAVLQQDAVTWNKMAKFYAYLTGLFLVASLLAVKPKVSFLVLAFATCEVMLSLGLYGLSQTTGIRIVNMMPHLESYHRFDHHPLLVGIPKPNYYSKTPYLKHDAEGRRQVAGAKKFEGLNVPSINVYGGSTTYDVKIINGHTWVDHLQRAFGAKARFYNYGVQGYSSVESLIQTAFYARHNNKYPACAVYYLGWNDIRNLHIPNLDPGYADFHLLGQPANLSLRNNRPTVSPLFNMLISLILYHYETATPPPDYWPDSIDTASIDENLEGIFTQNLQTIIAINKARGTKSFFIGQLLNRVRLNQMNPYGVFGNAWLPKVRNKDVWPVQEHYNALMKAFVEKQGAAYIDVPIGEFDDADFADEGHFSPQGAEKFSALVAPKLESCAK